MTRDAEAILQQALALSAADRADLAGVLLESIEPAAESEVEQAWKQEVARRVAALDAGEVTTVPWEEVRNRLLARLGDRKTG